jgi:LPXTG-motif cell wall-anchored protein
MISCQVDKDTIQRTSAAYESLAGQEGINNVGLERYKYEIDFRSTSNVPAEEFVVDDPLENVDAGYVNLEELWTPIVWGDDASLNSVSDGKFYVLYLTNMPSQTAPGYPNVTYPNTGYRVWPGTGALSTSQRHHLYASDLPLADGERLTAIRFDYGPVEIGFTSRNTAKTSLNGEWRDDHHGSITLPDSDGLDLLPQSAQAGTGLSSSGSLNALADSEAPAVNDWVPVQGRDDFYVEAAAQATGLKPAAYLVSAAITVQTEDEAVNIDASISARIARAELTDFDQDAVRTTEITTFEAEAKGESEFNPDVDSDFIDNLEDAGYTLRKGNWYPPQGAHLPRTGDTSTGYLILAALLVVLGAGALIAYRQSSRRQRTSAERGQR